MEGVWNKKVAQRSTPKSDLRDWQENVFRRARAKGDKTVEASEYSARIQHAGRRQFFNLGTANKAAAAAQARDIYVHLQANGWEPTLAKYKKAAAPPKADATLGDFLAEVKARADLKPKTIEGYAMALRKIAADASHIDGGNPRFDALTGGHQAWLERVHAVKLADLTPGVVQEWKRAFLARAGSDPMKQRSARVSANSFLRRAKSLFSPAITKHLEAVKLPAPLPFEGVAFEKRPSMRYRSGFDVFGLIETAREELSQADPEQFKIFLLAVMAGLRRREIDTLEWAAFRWEQGRRRRSARKACNHLTSLASLAGLPAAGDQRSLIILASPDVRRGQRSWF